MWRKWEFSRRWGEWGEDPCSIEGSVLRGAHPSQLPPFERVFSLTSCCVPLGQPFGLSWPPFRVGRSPEPMGSVLPRGACG